MSHYGCTTTRRGRGLIAKVLAGRTPLIITRVMVGTGKPSDDMDPADLEGLIEPIAEGTSTTPVYDGDTVHMTIEYRSDLNGGLEQGFWLDEFCVYAQDPDGGEVMLYYGTLGDYPQWVSAMSGHCIDVRRYPVSIVVGEDAQIIVDFNVEAFMTSEDVDRYCMERILPRFLDSAQELVDAHNALDTAHTSLQGLIGGLDARMTLMELMYRTEVSNNPFVITFDSLEGVDVEGVWDQSQKRIYF